MSDPATIEAKFWKALRSDMTVMLACDGAPPRPMASLVEDEDRGPIWFFTSSESELGQAVATGGKHGIMTFVDKGHSIWASAEGQLVRHDDPATIDRLWNPYTAAWFEDGRDDPKLRLIRFDAHEAQLWEDGSSLVAGVKAMLGVDPKEDARDHVAHVRLDD